MKGQTGWGWSAKVWETAAATRVEMVVRRRSWGKEREGQLAGVEGMHEVNGRGGGEAVPGGEVGEGGVPELNELRANGAEDSGDEVADFSSGAFVGAGEVSHSRWVFVHFDGGGVVGGGESGGVGLGERGLGEMGGRVG